MSYPDIERILIEGKENEFSNEAKFVIKANNYINNINDMASLMQFKRKLESIRDKFNTEKAYDEIYNFYTKNLVDGFFKVEDFSGEKTTIQYGEKNIDIFTI